MKYLDWKTLKSNFGAGFGFSKMGLEMIFSDKLKLYVVVPVLELSLVLPFKIQILRVPCSAHAPQNLQIRLSEKDLRTSTDATHFKF